MIHELDAFFFLLLVLLLSYETVVSSGYFLEPVEPVGLCIV